MHEKANNIKAMSEAKTVTIFAGNDCGEAYREHYFKVAYETGRLLAKAGFVVASGAGNGLMEECMRGAFEAGGRTIGIGLNVEGRKHYEYITDFTMFDRIGPRQEKLVALGDAYVALPGGVGTLYEIIQILAHKRLNEVPKEKPLILVDDYYQPLGSLLREMTTQGFLEAAAQDYYRLAATPEAVIDLLTNRSK